MGAWGRGLGAGSQNSCREIQFGVMSDVADPPLDVAAAAALNVVVAQPSAAKRTESDRLGAEAAKHAARVDKRKRSEEASSSTAVGASAVGASAVASDVGASVCVCARQLPWSRAGAGPRQHSRW